MFISIYAELGLDFTGIDLEHGRLSSLDSHAVDYSVVEAADISLEVGSTSGDRRVVGKVLDTGAASRGESRREVRERPMGIDMVSDHGGLDRGGSPGARHRFRVR